MWFFSSASDDALDAYNKATNTKVETPPAPVQQAQPQPSEDYSSANRELAKKLWEKNNGKSISRYQKGADILTTDINSRLEKTKVDWARESYKAQYGDGTDDDVTKWMQANQKKIEKDLYGVLTKQAVEQNVEFDRSTNTYQGYLAWLLGDQTPKDTRSFWSKTKDVASNIGHGLIDTPVGLGAALTDEILWTNTYKSYFGERTSIKEWNDSFADKATNLLGEQMAWLDVAFGVGTFLTAGTWAPVFASLSASIKGGWKSIAKSILKGGASEAMELSLKDVFKASGGDLVEWLVRGSGIKSSIADLAAKEGLDATAYMTKLRNTLNTTGKEIFNVNSKEYKAFQKSVDSFTSLDNLGVSGTIRKQNRWMESLSDGLGLPTQFVKFGEIWGKRTYSASFMGAAMNVILPSTTLLPGVGDWFESTGLRLGWALASQYALATRSGMVESERQKFIDTYGVDPEKANPALKAQWDKNLEYKMRYALPSEILTGDKFSERGNAGQLLWGAFDAASNFAWVMAGMHGIGKAYGFTSEQMNPIKMENGVPVSNIGFIKELNDIHNSDLDEATKQVKVEELKDRVAQGDPSLLISIRSGKELKNAIAEVQGYYSTLRWEARDVLMREWSSGMADVLKTMEGGDMDKAIMKLDAVNKGFSEVAGNLISSDAIKRANDKIDVLSTYFDKVRHDHKFLSNLTKQFIVNTQTSAIKDPTGAIIRGTDELTAAAKSIFSEIEDMNNILVDTFSAKWGYIARRYKESFDAESPLDGRIATMLEGTWLNPTKEMIVALRVPVVTALTKTQFEMKKFKDDDLTKVFDSVFSEYGSNIGTRLQWEKSLGDILRDVQAGNVDAVVRLSEDIEAMMNDDIIARKSKLDEHKAFLQQNAMQIAQMDKLFTDLTTQLHAEKSRERVEDAQFVRAEETTVASEIEILKARITELESKNQPTIIEKEDLKELEKLDPESTVTREFKWDLDPLSSPTAHRAIVEDVVQEKIAEQNEKSSKEYMEVQREMEDRLVTLKKFTDSMIRANEYAFKWEVKKSESQDFTDEVEDKEMDNFYKNDARIKAYDDMVFRGISDEYNKSASRFFDKTGNLDLDSLKKFTQKKNQILSKEQERLYSELALEYGNPEPNNYKIAQKARQIEELIRQQTTKNFTRNGIMEIARKSPNAERFQENLRASIKDTFKFTDEAVGIFMKNQFGDDINNVIPFYQLYKKQVEIGAFKFGFELNNGALEHTSTIFSREDPIAFTDTYGNTTLNRLDGLGTAELRKTHDVLSLNDISIGWKPLESYWVNGIEGIKIDDKKEYYRDNIMPAIQKEMESHGYIFLGDFQEEGKKRIFVKAREGVTTWEGAMKDLTGVDFRDIDSIKDPKIKNQAISNFQKYAKLLWWGEINGDTDTWKAAIIPGVTRENVQNKLKWLTGVDELITALEIPREEWVRHLMYEDNVSDPYDKSDKPAKEKVADGRTLNIGHYAATLNISIGAGKNNNIHKTATIAGPGQFIKSQDILADDASIADINIVNAMYKSQDPKIQSIMKFATDNFGKEWSHNADAVAKVHDLIYDYRVIDRIVPLSAYKNIYTRKIPDGAVWFEFENYKDGDMLDVPLENIWVKAIDFYKTPADRANETIKFSNQVIRNIHEIDGFSRAEADSINNVFNGIRKQDYDDLLELASHVWENPNLVIHEIEDRFGLKFNDFQKSQFITMGSSGNLERFFTNIMKTGVTTGTSLKWNQVDLTSLPNYWEARDRINKTLAPDMKDNWIVLSKKYYGHLDADRYMIFRYPVVSEKVINAPKIIWAEDLAEKMEMRMDIGSSMAASHTLIKKMEWDFDGDKIVLVTDPRVRAIQPIINKFVDQPKFDFEVDNSSANLHDADMSARDLWYETAYDTFEGKANIGILDNKISEVERFMQMGIISNEFVRDEENPYGKIGSGDARAWFSGNRYDYLRQILGVTLQRAVDNKSINVKAIDKIINDAIGITASNVAKVHKDIKLTYKSGDEWPNKKVIFPDGTSKELWQIRLLGTSADSTNFLSKVARNAGKTWEYTLSDAEYITYKRVSADEFKNSITGIQKILKKQNFLNDDTIKKIMDDGWDDYDIKQAQRKDITKIRYEYIKVKKAYDELVSFYGKDVIDRDPQMRFIGNMEGSFLKEFPDMKSQLHPTLTKALDKVREKFPITIDSSVASQFKTLFYEYDKESKKFSKLKDDGLKAQFDADRAKKMGIIEDKIYALADAHNIEDFDALIIGNMRSPNSNIKNLMTAEGRGNLDSLVHAELNWTPLEKTRIYDTTVDLSPIYKSFWKIQWDDFIRLLDETMGGEQMSKYFQSPRYQMLKNDKINETQRDMYAVGIHPEQFKEFSEVIQNADKEEAARTVNKIKDITEADMKIVLDLVKETWDTKAAMELLMSMGYKEIAWEKLWETARDAYTTVVNSPFTKPNC